MRCLFDFIALDNLDCSIFLKVFHILECIFPLIGEHLLGCLLKGSLFSRSNMNHFKDLDRRFYVVFTIVIANFVKGLKCLIRFYCFLCGFGRELEPRSARGGIARNLDPSFYCIELGYMGVIKKYRFVIIAFAL